MKHPFLRRALSLALCLVMLGSLLSVIPGISPLVYAGMHYEGVSLDFDSDTATIRYSCGECGADYEVECSIDEFYDDRVGVIMNDCTEIEIFTDYCQMCYLDHVCMECLEPIESCDLFCYECHQCENCHTDDLCMKCGQCTNELCPDCQEAGFQRCEECHEDFAYCDYCSRCLYALEATEEVCFNYRAHETHCTTCDEAWLCLECCFCFLGCEEWFCENCELCLECAVENGAHCRHCVACFDSEADRCEGNEDLCVDCCVEEGNHCELCGEHVEEWCEGGQECGHCYDCAESEGWICGDCGQCILCNGFDFCEECGLCEDCCTQNRESSGCECLEYCVESSDFENEEHLCAQCQAVFSCNGSDFCDFCGLCEECCLENSEAENCVCGLCVQDAEFEAHICDQCGDPTCVRGDFCETCNFCEECCIENSEAAGCECGLCVESDEFSKPDHKCANCGEAFSCVVEFCDMCGYCVNCCTCGSAEATYHGTPTQPGEILIHPTDRSRSVSRDNIYDRAANTVSFRVRAYNPNGDLQYQWYYTVDGGAPVELEDEETYIQAYDETLVFVGGAQTDTLTVAVPSDACHREYHYFCAVSDGSGQELSRSDSARLYGRHSYVWQWADSACHMFVCVGKDCGHAETGAKKAHEIGPWQYVSYATATKGARMVRRCNACGGIAEERTTEALDGEHSAHDYEYTPVKVTNAQGESVSNSHIRMCRCGRQEGGQEAHTWGQWIVTQAATEQAKGSKYHDCLLCHYRETVTIQRQTHEHLWNLHNSEGEVLYHGGYNKKSHFQYCGAPDCKAVAFVEPHQFSSWRFQTESGTPDLENRDATVERICETCGYRDEIFIRQGYRPLCFVNANRTALSGSLWNSKGRYTCEVTAKPPAGYYFVHWRSIGGGPINYEEHNVYYDDGTPVYLSDGSIRTVPYKPTDETVVISLERYRDGEPIPLETIYCLEAYCERYSNYFTLYDPTGASVYDLTEGEWLDNAELFGELPAKWDAELMDAGHGAIWYESQVEDDYDVRTVTLHLNGYDGGAIELNDTGLPCNLNIIVDGDSDITTTGQQGILGCLTGGDVTISSPNGSELRINVRSGKEDCYGIRTGRARQYHSDKLTICGSVTVQLDVTDTYGSSLGAAYGLYSDSWVAIEDSASLDIGVSSYAWDVAFDGQTVVSAVAIRAAKEIQIDTDGYIGIYAANVDTEHGRKGVGLDAKNILIDKVSDMWIVYPDNTRNAYSHEPTYDPQHFIFDDDSDGARSFRRNGKTVYTHAVKQLTVQPGYAIHFDVGEGGTLNVEGAFQNTAGDYIVKAGSNLVFYSAPAPGHCNEIVLVDGTFFKRGASDDGVRSRYVLEAINAPHTVSVGSGVRFAPFASQPALSQTNVYFGSEAQLSYRMNDVLTVLKTHEEFSSGSAKPKYGLAGSAGSYTSGALIEGGQTINRVFLQRYNENNGLYENTGVSFTPAVVSSVSFTDAKAAEALQTVRYRLLVLYDGREYPSEDFTVHWTDDPNDVAAPMTTAVELYVREGRFNVTGAHCEDGGAWVRLDSVTDVLVYDWDKSVGYAMERADYNRACSKHKEKLLLLADFDYHTGVLGLYGDMINADLGDGEQLYDVGEQLMAIRVPDDAEGGLVLDVRGFTTVSGDYEEFGWEGWYSGDTLVRKDHTYAETAVVRNDSDGGFVRITSSVGEELYLRRSGRERDSTEGMVFSGVRANGDILVDGNVYVEVSVSANDGCYNSFNCGADRYGLDAAGAVCVRDSAEVRVNLPIRDEVRILKGRAVAVRAEELSLSDDSVTSLESNAMKLYGDTDCYAVEVGAMNVTGSARLNVTGRGNVQFPIRVDGDILWATDDTVTVKALANSVFTEGIVASGEVRVKAPTSVVFEYRDGATSASLVREGEFILDGDFVTYHVAGSETEPATTRYYAGTPYTVTVLTDTGAEGWGAHTLTVTRNGKTLLSGINEGSIDVCMGDTISYTAADPWSGYSFGGWTVHSPLLPEDFVNEGATVSFTMPDRDLTLQAVYNCWAFDAEEPHFIITNAAATEGTLYWRIDTAAPQLYDVELEYLDENGEWVSFRYDEGGYSKGWSLVGDMTQEDNALNDDYIYRGASVLRFGEHNSAERVLDTDRYKVYRINANYGVYISQPFTIDFSNGVHVLLSEDMQHPELIIPADYVGTEYLIDLSKYVWSDSGSGDWGLYFHDRYGSEIEGSVCEATIFENGMLRFVRNGAHEALYGMEGNTYVGVSFPGFPRVFMFPFDFGEIYDTHAYPLIVSGRRVTDHNKDDVLGDGTVSYNPASKTLTLNGAHINELYPMRSDGELSSAAYAIVGAQDLTVELIGDSFIHVDRSSFCHSQAVSHTFHGSIVGIGNAVNDKWRPYLTEEDDFRITITGDGSLTMQVEGEYSVGVNCIGDLTVNSGTLDIQTKYCGLVSEGGSFTMNGGTLRIDAKEQCCVEVQDTRGRFTLNGGTLTLDGGTESEVISMGPETVQNAEYLRVNGGALTIRTKSVKRNLTSRAIYFDPSLYAVLDADGGNAFDRVEAPATIEALSYLRFVRRYPIWVNGEQFTDEHSIIPCGKGYATYLPEANTVYLHSAIITAGVAGWTAGLQAAGIYAEQPFNLYCSGYSRIDLSSRTYVNLLGQPCELNDEETEATRQTYGVYLRNVRELDDAVLGLVGGGNLTIKAVQTGIETDNSVSTTLGGPKLTVTDCDGGISSALRVKSGALTIDAAAYSVYGTLNTEDYEPLYAWGGTSRSAAVQIDLSQTEAATEAGWGYHYPYFKLSNAKGAVISGVSGTVESDAGGKTTISVNASMLPRTGPVKVVVVQYRGGQLRDVKIAELAPEDLDNAVKLTFGSDKDAEYRIFALDADLKPLTDAYDIES